ncbi:MAG TPA: efflux RND transporter periplasmic adaptor subunit [Candidatus Saccharimonadales bacterium]|nr:efflux RND transporter periplasmic adaptor subunit [Candidatus Saccharimonadales bacterium]
MKKIIAIGCVIAVVIGIVATIVIMRKPVSTAEKKETAAEPKVVEIAEEAQRKSSIEVAEAQERVLADPIELTGVVAPDEARVGHILPLAQGVVERILVKLGDRVEKGQPLVELDNVEMGELAAQHLRASAQLQTAYAKLDVARRSLERAENLLKVEAISQREYDERRAQYDQARAEVAGGKAELLQIDQKLRRFGLTNEAIQHLSGTSGASDMPLSRNIVRAPFSGIITKFNVAPGELVTPDKEIFALVDPSSVWVVADVYQKDIGRTANSGPCEVTASSYPETKFIGTVGDVSDFLDPESRTAKLRCVVANRDSRLKLDMFANVTIPSKQSRTALAVPAIAVQQIESEKVVFVQMDATHFEKREVELGIENSKWIEIRSGLRRGEKVAAEGAFYVKSALLKEQLSGDE